ncbi:MAG: hypothetical protein AAGF47_10335 [Planctomycetota bacterium]
MTEAETTQDRRDILIARIVDGRASAEDWRELRAVAADDQSVWSEIAEEQELTREVEGLVDRAAAAADRIELPPPSRVRGTPAHRMRLVGIGGGWAAAAVVGVLWIMGAPTSTAPVTSPPAGPTQSAGMPNPINTAADALKEYLRLGQESGEVIGELPQSLVLDRTPNEAGGYDVIYLRQIVEKTTVDGIYQTATGDTGQTVVVPKPTPSTERTGASPLPVAW